MPKHKFSLVACARWEEMQIQEWVEYHKSIGFNHIYLYSNDDDPTALFRAVAAYTYGPDPFITFRHWPEVGAQIDIYLNFLDTFKHETEWFSFLDIDEFFVLKGCNDIFAFMLEYEASVDCLYFNWVIYGNSDVVRRDDRPTLTSYLRRAAKPDGHTKMLCRSGAIDSATIRFGQLAGRGAFWHFLDNYKLPGVRCRDVLHHPTDGYSADFPASTTPFVTRQGFAEAIIDRAYIAHFQFRSEEDFMRRWRRGGFPNGEQWRSIYENGIYKVVLERNNAVYDSYLAAYWHDYTAPAMRFRTMPNPPGIPYDNVALNKPSWQSSVHQSDGGEPPLSRVWGGGNNGLRTGTYGFRTSFEVRPWWIVDLLAQHRLVELRIYKPEDDPAAANLDVLASDDGAAWTALIPHGASETFGTSGAPLIVRPASGGHHRFVMLRLKGAGCLRMDEIEVYGDPVDVDVPLLASALSVTGLNAA